MERQTEKSFNSNIAAIKKGAEAMAMAIHNAGLFAIAQANEHGNIGYAILGTHCSSQADKQC